MDEGRLSRVEASLLELERLVKEVDRRLAIVERGLSALPPSVPTFEPAVGEVAEPSRSASPDIVSVLSLVGRSFVIEEENEARALRTIHHEFLAVKG